MKLYYSLVFYNPSQSVVLALWGDGTPRKHSGTEEQINLVLGHYEQLGYSLIRKPSHEYPYSLTPPKAPAPYRPTKGADQVLIYA